MESDKGNAKRLRAARKRAGLTQSDLGERLTPTLNKQQIYKLEKSQVKIRMKMAEQLAAILGGEPGDFLDGDFTQNSTGSAPPTEPTINIPPINPASLRDVLTSLARMIGGDDAAKSMAGADFNAAARNCAQFLKEVASEQGALTNHLTQWLLTAAAASAGVGHDHPNFAEYNRWRQAAQKAAALFLDLTSERPSSPPAAMDQ